MAVYKVIQDIEAEDKLLGPLTLKGFIYAAIAGVLVFINVRLLITSGLGPVRWLLILIFFFPMVLFGVLASPLGRDQPTEVWLLSHVRFLIKPRQRIWNQSGISHLVTVTVPKRIERHLTKGLSQTEVHSRLQALTMTLDSHGWVVKSPTVNLSPAPQYVQNNQGPTDRLVDAAALPQAVPVVDVHPADDIMDEQNNPTAQKFDQLVKQAAAVRKQEVMDKVRTMAGDEGARAPAAPAPVVKSQPAPQAPAVTPKPPAPPKVSDPAAGVTAVRQADNMELAQSGSDFKVSTLEKLANRQSVVKQLGPNEVEIDLH